MRSAETEEAAEPTPAQMPDPQPGGKGHNYIVCPSCFGKNRIMTVLGREPANEKSLRCLRCGTEAEMWEFPKE